MSRSKHKFKFKKNPQNCIPVTETAVRQSLAQKETQKALDLAKRYAKEYPGAEAENLLVQAYQERIRDLQQAGLIHDAKNLIEVAKNRCPKWKVQFESVIQDIFQFPLSRQDISRIVTLLQKSPSDEAARLRAEEMMRMGLGNPHDLLECNELPSEHPLRIEAIWVWEALDAAASDMLEEERTRRIESLTQVSRRSPLVYWCFFIRALEAYYHFEDTRARELLARIPQHSILMPAAYLLECKLKKADKPTGLSALPTRELWKSLSPLSLRTQWLDMMNAIRSRHRTELREKVLQVLRWESWSSPWVLRAATKSILQSLIAVDILDRVIQTEIEKVLVRVWGDEGKLIYLLDANNLLSHDDPFESADQLEKLQHIWKDSLSPKERAVILGRAATYAQQDELDFDDFHPAFPSGFADDFDDDLEEPGHGFSIRLLETACRLDPQPEYFDPLVSTLRKEKRKPSEIESVLSKWHETCPDDCTPLIQLFEETEKRGAFQKAIKFIEKAEQIDRLNPKVRNARHRLNWQIALKHLQQRKFHLVEKDLLDVHEHEMRPAKLALFYGLKRFIALVQNDGEIRSEEEIPISETILFYHLQTQIQPKTGKRMEIRLPDLTDGTKLAAFYDLRDALTTIGDVPNLPMSWFLRFPPWITQAPDMSEELLLRISKTILTNGIPAVVMAATDRGLHLDGPRLHEFLFYRAMALLKESPAHSIHAEECLMAVIALCRARGDYELERQAVVVLKPFRNDLLGHLFGFEGRDDSLNKEISSTDVERILRRERKRTEPTPPRKPPKRIREVMKKISEETQIQMKKNNTGFSDESHQEKEAPAEEMELKESDTQPLLW